MTAEIAILNRHAVVLAADSAVTLKLPSGSKSYNTTSKLFALSEHEPVGVMIYGADGLMGLPWETIAKMYRRELGNISFEAINQYATDFVAFLAKTLRDYCSEEQQVNYFSDLLKSEFLYVVDDLRKSLIKAFDFGGVLSTKQVSEIIEREVTQHWEAWNGYPEAREEPISAEKLDGIYAQKIDEAIKGVFGTQPLSDNARGILRKLPAEWMRKVNPQRPRGSGVVIAGFGSKQLFPYLVELEVAGMIADTLDWRRRQSVGASVNDSAFILPFAQDQEMRAFLDLVHPTYRQTLFTSMRSVLFQVINDPATGTPPTLVAEKTQHQAVEKAMQHVLAEIEPKVVEPSKQAVLQAVAHLPKDELAAMAEALVSLAAFKQRITPVWGAAGEAVGGPVDVAVISKGDGFVWIKCKKYYDPDLNPPRRPL